MLQKFKKYDTQSEFGKYLANTSWLLGERILRMATGLFVGIWLARYLGPEEFGMLSYALSFSALFTVMAALGLDEILVRELLKWDPNSRNKLLGTAFVLKLFGAVAVLILLFFSIFSISNDRELNIIVMLVASTVVFQSFNVVDFYFQSKVLSRYVAYANAISLFISSLLKVMFILSEAPLITFAWLVLFESVILSLGYIYFYLKVGERKNKWVFDKKTALLLLKDSWPLIISSVVITAYMKVDQVMIKSLLDAGAVGQYAAAVGLSEAWHSISFIITGSIFPSILKARKHSDKVYYDKLQNVFNLMAGLSFVIAMVMTFCSIWLVDTLYGGQYDQTASVLTIHIWSSVFVFLGAASGKWYIAESLPGLIFFRAFFGMFINVFLNLMLIPKYGIQGAAMATLISQFGAHYIFDLFSSKSRRLFYMKSKSLMLFGFFSRNE